jgi:hypothetical protein
VTESDEWSSVLAAVAVIADVEVLQRESFDRVVQRLTTNFLKDSNSVWWWTRLKIPPRAVSYSSSDEFFPLLRRLVPEESRAVLLVMNDNGIPDGAIEGPFSSLISVIEDSIGFEFIICGLNAEWAVFDTHYNELLILGGPT